MGVWLGAELGVGLRVTVAGGEGDVQAASRTKSVTKKRGVSFGAEDAN